MGRIWVFFIAACCQFVLLQGIGECRKLITYGLSLSGDYTSNVELSDDDEDSDFIGTVSPRVGFQWDQKTGGLNLDYSPGFAYYFMGTQDPVLRHNADLRLWDQVTKRLRVDLTNNFIRTEVPFFLDDPVITRRILPAEPVENGEEQPGEPGGTEGLAPGEVVVPVPEERLVSEDRGVRTGREPYYSNTTTARAAYQFGAADSVYFGYRYGILENDDPEQQDSMHHGPFLGVVYWFNTQNGIQADGNYRRGDYSGDSDSIDADSIDADSVDEWYGRTRLIHRFTQHLDGFVQYAYTNVDYHGGESDLARNNEEDYTVHAGTVGIDYHITETVFLTASTGYYFRQKEDDDDSGFLFNLDGTWVAKQFKRGAIVVSGGTGYTSTLYGPENLGFTRYYEGNVSAHYAFTKRLSGRLLGGYTLNEYQDVDRDDHVYTAFAGLNYRVTSWMSVGAYYRHRTVDSTDDAKEYNDDSFGFNVDLTKLFGGVIRLD